MNQDIKARWVAKLREPNRHQGTGKLRDEWGAQCCLDLLCEVAVEDKVIDAPVLDKETGCYEYRYFWGDYWKHETELLPKNIIKWAELNSSDPELYAPDYGSRLYGLTECNDDIQFTFLEIADLIEEQL